MPSWTPSPPPTQDPIKAARGEAAESPHCIRPKASRQASRRSRAPRTRRSRREGFAADQTELAQTSGTHGRPNHGPGRSWNLRRCGVGVGVFYPLTEVVSERDFLGFARFSGRLGCSVRLLGCRLLDLNYTLQTPCLGCLGCYTLLRLLRVKYVFFLHLCPYTL